MDLLALVKEYEALPESTAAQVELKAQKRVELEKLLSEQRFKKPPCPA
jgi:hypothetical protein